MAFTPIDEEEIINEPVAEEAKPRFIPVEDDEFFGIVGEEEAPEPTSPLGAPAPAEAPKSRFTPISDDEFFGIETPKEEPQKPSEGVLRQTADLPVQFAIGINNSVKGLTDLFGADNAISQNLSQNVDWYRGLLSASAKQDEEEVGRILQEAEGKGMLDQLSAGLEAFTVAPADFVASGLGSLATFAATGIAGRAAAAVGAARAGLTGAAAAKAVETGVRATQLATGAGMGAGIVKGEIYQSVKDEMLAQGKTEEESRKIAMEAQSYMGKNLDQILLGAGLGTIDAFTGAEKIIGKVLTKGGLKPDASRIGNIIKSGITEAAPEFVQAAQEKFASNLALQREGVNVSLTQGVFSQGALEGLVGLGMGVGAGAIEPRIQTPPTKEEVSAAAAETQDVARQSMDVAPATASLVEGEAEQIIKSQAETPEQRVARLQREAQEGVGIDLEEEVPVSGLPPVSELPPVKEGFVRLYHGGAAETAGEFTPYLDTALGYAQQSKGSIFYLDVPEDSEFLRRGDYDEQGNISERGILSARQSRVPDDIALTAKRSVSGFEAQPVTPTPEAPVTLAIAPVEPVVTEGEAQPITATRTVEDAIRDKDTFIYNDQRGAVSVEDGVTVFRPFGTQDKFEIGINPNQTIGEIEGIQWARKGQVRTTPVESKPETATIIESQPDITIDDVDQEESEFEVPAALIEIEKSKTLNDLADLFDTGDSKVVQEGKRARKVSQTPEYYRAVTPQQINLANRLIDNALRIIDALPITDQQKQGMAEPFLLLDQDITNYENNPNYQQYKASIRTEIRPAGQAGAFPETETEVAAGIRELEQRAKAEAERLERARVRRPVAPPPVTPQLEPLRRVARAEQTEEDVAGLVDAGFVEVYKGQPVLTQAGLDALPEAERPRLTPEARKIQIDTRTSEAAAEAISKNLRIGVDQVPADVRMPEGWTLEGDIYVPPQPQAVTEPEVAPEVVTEPEVAVEEPAKVDPINVFKGGIRDAGFKYLTYSDLRREGRTQDWEKEGGVTIDGSYYPTAVIGDTKVAFTTSGLYVFKNQVRELYESDVDANGNTIFTIQRIVTPEGKRGQGSASKALAQITDAADKAGLTLQLQPAVIKPLAGKGGKALTAQQLVDWYKRNGFVQKFEGSDAVLIRSPKPTAPAIPEVVPPRKPDAEPQAAADQEIKTIQEKYQTSETTAGLIINQNNFVANEAGTIPEGWVVERIGDRNIALSPVWQKSRRDIQEAIRKFTVLERAALSGRLFEEGWINEDASKQYIEDVRRIGDFKQEEIESSIAATEAKANERFDDLVERVFKANRANVSDVAGEVSKPTVDLAAEEQARSTRPVVSYGAALDPNVIEFKTARQALQMLADANIIATGDEDADGNAAWRTDLRVQKPRYVLLQEAASILAKTNLRALDAELIRIDSGGGRANRAYAGNIFIPRTRGSRGETAYLEPWILLHEVGHTLTSDAFQKYVPDIGKTGIDYYNQLKAAQKDKAVPREVKRAITLYIDTIKALGLEKEYFKKNGLASNDGDRAIRNAKIRTANKIINPFTGKQITTDDMYALGDMHEFYAQAWNSQSFQDILKQIKVTPQRSAFQKFVDIIKDVLGFESDTMAYSVIDASLRLASLEAPTDTGATIESRIDFAKRMAKIKALPKTKADWLNYDRGKFSFGQKMARNKFTKLGYDYITFRVQKEGRDVWYIRAEISESWNSKKVGKTLLPSREVFAISFNNKATAQDIAQRLMSDVTGMVNEEYGKLRPMAPRTKPSPVVRRGKFSPSVPASQQQDRDYLDAVERGDLDAASRMVDEAAKRVGIDTFEIREAAELYKYYSDRAKESNSEQDYNALENFGYKYNKSATKAGLSDEAATQMLSDVGSGLAVSDAVRDAIATTSIKSADPVTYDDQGNIIPLSQRFQPEQADIRYRRRVQMGRAGMETIAVEARLQELGFPTGGIIRVVNEPDADFEGRTIILDGKVTGIELNAAAMRDNATIDRVLNHEFAESANADGALNRLVERLTPKEKKEINDTITRLRYEERARSAEEAARAIETLAEAWRGRGFFTRAVARVEAWGSKLGLKLTRRAAEYIAARNLSDINVGFKAAYNRFINVRGEAREGRAFVTPEENARFLELARNPEANREELQKMVDDAARLAGSVEVYHGGIMDWRVAQTGVGDAVFFTEQKELAQRAADLRGNFGLRVGENRGVRKFFISKENILDATADDAAYQLALRNDPQYAKKMDEVPLPKMFTSPDWRYIEDRIGLPSIKEAGFNGVKMLEWKEGLYGKATGNPSTTYAIFYPNQIKSADPVTYDDNGNIIPLDQRFQPATADIRYSRTEIRESRREPVSPTFTEESPEAKTLSNLKASMAKVDSASEAKGGKPETQKVSEIAANWMESGGDERALQDAIAENTNLSPVNAARVAKVIAKQYDIQQSIATAFLETQTGLSVEALPEGVTLPKEVDPDRPKPVMSRLFEVFMGVRVPPVKIQVNEKAALKDQIRLKAAANRAAKAEQKRTAEEVVEVIKAMELLGPVRPKQVQALAKRAARVIWTSEKSVEAFSEYAAKVVENANYDADLREAKDAQKRAKQLSTQKKVAMSPQREVLEDVSKVPVNKLDDPRMFAEAVNYYLRGFKAVLSPDYVVIPDAEMESYLSGAQSETMRNQRDLDREANERLARKYGIEPDQVNEMMESIDIIKQIEAQENREALENLLTEKAFETQQGLRGYDIDNLRADQRSIVSSMLKVDPKALDPEERQRFIRITNNIIYNNQTNGAEYFVAVAKGQQSAREAAQDSAMVSKNRAWINLLPRFVSERMQRGWALELQSIADTFRNAFGKGAMAQVYDLMGMLDLNLGFTKANNTIDEIQKKIGDFHRGLEKKYKAAARNQDGLLAEGIVGFLIQSVPKKDETESINQRRDLIRQDIANRRRSTAEPDRVSMADRIEAILNLIDGDSVEAVLNNMKREFRPNYESLIWYKDTLLPQYKDFLKNFDENFNDQANNYENPNYLTIGFTSAGPSLAITPEEQSLFYNQVSLNPKQSAYTIKRVDYTEIPKDRTTKRPKEIEFNLRRNVFNGLSDQINKAYTSSAWQRIASFMKTPEAEVVFGGAANKDFFIERLNRLRLSRMRRGSMGSGGAIEKAVDSLSVISRKLGTGIALGGIYQWIKQPPDQLVTAWGSGGRGDLLARNIAPSTQKAARELLNKFSIGRRGDASAGYKYINQMEGHQNRLERYFSESKWDQAKEQAGKIADVWMVALKSSDFLAASAAWMTYYEGELNKKDIKIDDWSKEASLIESDPARRQAAAFAEQMTDIYQGSSDPTSMATFAQSGKTGWENFVKAIFVPFNSFAIQQRMRLYSDAVDAINGNKSGVGGLAGTIGGLILFHTTKRYVIPAISGVGIGVLYGLMGVDMDEPDEEKQKEEANKNWRQFLADMTGNILVGGTPQIVESQFIDAMNRASYLVSLQLENESILNDEGEIMSYDQYSKERSPFYRYKSYDNAMSLGMLDIGMGQAEQVALQTKMLASPEEMEMYTPEEQRMLYFSALSEWLLLMRLNDTDFARLVSKARRDMIKAAKDREKEIKAIRSGR